MNPSIDLNCDMGESYGAWVMGNDAAVLRYVSSANIACGFHGGDPATMRKTVAAALAQGVALARIPACRICPASAAASSRPVRRKPTTWWSTSSARWRAWPPHRARACTT